MHRHGFQWNARRLSQAAALVAALAALPTAVAFASSSFEARITIRSQCSIHPLFGAAAAGGAAVICQPGVTPYQSLDIPLDGDTGPLATSDILSTTNGGQAQATFWPRQAIAIPPPFSNATAKSKLLYIIF